MDQALKLLEELVKIESLPRQEKELSSFLRSELISLGLVVEEDGAADRLAGSSGNLLAWNPAELREAGSAREGSAREPGSGLLLVAHMDREFPAAAESITTSRGYLAGKEGSVLGADNLAGISIILGWLRAVRGKMPADWGIALTVAEEIGLLGARYLPEDFLTRFSRALILDGEAPVGTIYTSEPPAALFSLVPAERLTAAEAKLMLQYLEAKLSLAAIPVKVLYFDSPLPAAGIKRAGLLAAVRGNRQMAVNSWNNLIDEILQKGAINKADFSTRMLFSYPGLNFSGGEDWLIPLKQVFARNSLETKLLPSSGISEASVLTSRGLPAVNLGIGVEAVHTSRERVKLIELHRMIEVLENLSNF